MTTNAGKNSGPGGRDKWGLAVEKKALPLRHVNPPDDCGLSGIPDVRFSKGGLHGVEVGLASPVSIPSGPAKVSLAAAQGKRV